MKKLILFFFFLILETGSFRANNFFFSQGDGKKPEICREDYTHIVDFYSKNYSYNKVYFKFTTQRIENGKTGNKLTNELWLKDTKFRYSNDFVTIIQDMEQQVVIFKDSHRIVIKKADRSDAKNNYGMPSKVLIDSLMKISSEIECSKEGNMGRIVFQFPQVIEKKPNPIKQAKITYILSSGQIQKGEFDYFSKEGLKRETYEYVKLTKNFDEKILEGSAVSKVLSGKTLRNEYKGYELRDLRFNTD